MDGTFHSAPSLAKGHMYQILKVHVEYKNNVFTVFKAIMTNKTRSLYDGVYEKLKELLPDTVKPTTLISDYEKALQDGLQAIFPDAELHGCWFHFSQVKMTYHFIMLKTSFQPEINFRMSSSILDCMG